jgi:DNA-directed RNA polymerase subunit beta'
VKIPRAMGRTGDITGGLPRITELFEARNPSNPAVVSEIDGEVTFGKIKRGNREVVVTSKMVRLRSTLFLCQNRFLFRRTTYVRAGIPLSDGAVLQLIFLPLKDLLLFRSTLLTKYRMFIDCRV